MPSLKEFLQTSVHPKGYKPNTDDRDDFLIETEEQFIDLLQRLLQLEQYQEVLRLYCSTKVDKLKEFEKSCSVTSIENLIYETSPIANFGEVYRGEITFRYSKTDVRANKLLVEFSHQGLETKTIRCQVEFKVLPNALIKPTFWGDFTTESLVISDIWVSHFEKGFPFSLINDTLLEGLLGVSYDSDYLR